VVTRWASVTGPGAILGLVLLNVDYVVISRALGEAATGVYSFAYRIAFVPYIMGAVVLGQVAFPIYTRLLAQGGKEALANGFTRFLHVVTAATGGLYLAFGLLADRIIVISPRWEPSAPVLQVLCVYGMLLGLILTGYEALRASGRPGLYLRAQLVHVTLLVVGALSMVRLGIIGVAWAQVGAALLTAALVVAMLSRLRLLNRGVGLALLRPGIAAAVVGLAHWAAAAAGLLPANDSLVGGVLLGVLVLAGYAAVLLTLDRGLKRDVLVALRRG
jgi:PST family polysaccharide transporter